MCNLQLCVIWHSISSFFFFFFVCYCNKRIFATEATSRVLFWSRILPLYRCLHFRARWRLHRRYFSSPLYESPDNFKGKMSTNVFYSETKLIVETAIKTAFGVIENDKEENSLKKPNVRRKVSERFVLTMNGSIKRPRSERSSGSEIL